MDLSSASQITSAYTNELAVKFLCTNSSGYLMNMEKPIANTYSNIENQQKSAVEQHSPVCSTSTSENSGDQPNSPEGDYCSDMGHPPYYNADWPPSKRKSNICLSRENIMKSWTSTDDDNLLRLADQYKNDWKKIAKRIITNSKKKVTPNFLKNRYKEVAGDHIKKGVKFSHEEDLLIARLFQDFGTAWTRIAEQFQDRTPVMIKNRYYSHIRRKGLLPELAEEASQQYHHHFPNPQPMIPQPVTVHITSGAEFIYPQVALYQAADNTHIMLPRQTHEDDDQAYFTFNLFNEFEIPNELHDKVTPHNFQLLQIPQCQYMLTISLYMQML